MQFIRLSQINTLLISAIQRRYVYIGLPPDQLMGENYVEM